MATRLRRDQIESFVAIREQIERLSAASWVINAIICEAQLPFRPLSCPDVGLLLMKIERAEFDDQSARSKCMRR